MMIRKSIAHLFRLFFTLNGVEKHYFGIYQKIMVRWNLFKNTTITALYHKKFKFEFKLTDWVQNQMFFLGYSDIRGINFMKKVLKSGDLFFDIGANVGGYSLVASDLVGESGKVFAFEPVSDIHSKLSGTLKNNNITNVVLTQKAVTNTNEPVTIYFANNENEGTASIFQNINTVESNETVEGTTIDSFAEEHKTAKISLIKIDIEGAEWYALQGMKEVLKKFKPTLIVEITKDTLQSTNHTSEQIFNYLNELGYRCYLIEPNGELTEGTHYPEGNYHNFVFR